MLSEKVFEVTVDVRNPINYAADAPRHLMAALQDAYAGRCFKGAFIVRVVEVLEASACRISTTNTSGEGRVDARFLAEVAVFSRWDILVGVEVASAQQILVGRYEAPARAEAGASPKAVVTILASKAVETLAVGQRAAVRVVMAQHPPRQAMAAVVGALLVCDQDAPVYRLRAGVLDASARAELAPVLARVEAELEARAELVGARRADVWFFELLLYSFRRPAGGADDEGQRLEAWPGGPAWEGPPAFGGADAGAGERAPKGRPEAVSVLALARRALAGEAVPVAGVWSRPLALYRSSPLACRVPPGGHPPAEWGAPLDEVPCVVFAEYLKNILDFLVAVREMVALYGSRQEVDRHRNIWAVMRAAQRPAGEP